MTDKNANNPIKKSKEPMVIWTICISIVTFLLSILGIGLMELKMQQLGLDSNFKQGIFAWRYLPRITAAISLVAFVFSLPSLLRHYEKSMVKLTIIVSAVAFVIGVLGVSWQIIQMKQVGLENDIICIMLFQWGNLPLTMIPMSLILLVFVLFLRRNEH